MYASTMKSFNYWPRYVARVLQINAVYRGPFMDWKIEAKYEDFPTAKDYEQSEKRNYPLWEYSEQYPWNMANRLSSFPYPDMFWTIKYPDDRKVKSKISFSKNENTILKGDRVQILVGPDKGKIGIVSSVIKVRNLVIVEDLNNFYYKVPKSNAIHRKEIPLNKDNEVSLIDPEDNKPCEIEWRYDERGNRVRVSKRTGRIIPTPMLSESLDDGNTPLLQTLGPKDTSEKKLIEVTYKPVLRTFNEDILNKHNIKDDRVRAKTFWY